MGLSFKMKFNSKRILIRLLLTLIYSHTQAQEKFENGFGQKPNLQLESHKSWPEVTGGMLSNNGKYAFYEIRNYPITQNTFVLKATTGKEILHLLNLRDAKFDDNSQYLLGKLSNDTLLIYDLQKGLSNKLSGVGSYELLKLGKKQKLVLKTITNVLSICDLTGKQLYSWPKVNQYKFSFYGYKLLIEQQENDTTEFKSVVCKWIDTDNGKERLIYRGLPVSDVIFDSAENQAAFMVNTDGHNSIYHYTEAMVRAELFIEQTSVSIDNSKTIETGNYWAFSRDGKCIFFSLQENIEKNEGVNLKVWSYQDAYLKSFYDGHLGKKLHERQYLTVAIIENKHITQLTKGNQRLLDGSLKFETDSICLVEMSNGPETEEWNPNSQSLYSLCYTRTGNLVPLELYPRQTLHPPVISPTGKYIVSFIPTLKNYLCYDVNLGIKKIISGQVQQSFIAYDKIHYPKPENYVVGITGWLNGDQTILINTTYDIWKVDPKAILPSINMTNGIGEKYKTVFYLADEEVGGAVGINGKIMLSAFDTRTKDYGVYQLDVKGKQGLKKISMGQRYSRHMQDVYTQLSKEDFLVTNRGGGYLLRSEKADQYPNYFYSKDMKAFTALSNLQPQKAYNWLTSELCTYKDSIGNEFQGVLYKPENFSPNKKYPVVFNIYETKSNLLNEFPTPGLVGVDFSIPLLVSNGYLVFLPDIRGKLKFSGDAALKSVLAATDYLSNFSWVDTKKMALAGHSFGGYETNYIITHTNRFAAALSGAGISDMISFSTGLWGFGNSQDWMARYSYLMMGNTLSDDPETYIRNSPILNAKDLNTPTLFMHNDGDGNVNYLQTQSFFIVLRSLQKPVWWLNYKNQGHGVGGEKNQLDFNTKTWQFFDHYLKDKPMPAWMKEHI